MTTVNVGTTKNTVTVNGETRVVTVKTGEVRVVTVKVAGPQGPAIPDGNKGDVSISSNGTAISINTGAVTSAKILDGTIVNADINDSANIASSKLANSGVSSGSYGSGSAIPTITVSDKGIVTGISTSSINTDLVADSTPQLGGNLDLNSNNITGTGDINITGDILISGTVDGRDLSADGSKLDGIQTGAKDDQTSAEIKTLLNSDGIVNAQIDTNAAIANSKLADSGVSAGSFGSGSAIPTITVNDKGIVTAISTNSVNTTTNLSTSTSTTDVTISSSTGNNASISEASGSAAGVMSVAQHNKLDGIQSGATDDQTASEIKTLLNSDGIVNSNVDASAAIAGTKINPNFGSQNIVTSGNTNCKVLNLSGANPLINFTDTAGTPSNPDYRIINNSGFFSIQDITDNFTARFLIASDGTATFTQNLNANAGLDVTGGDITGVLGSAVTGTTQSASDNSTKIATTSYVDTAVSSLVDSAPSTLDTLKELSDALGSDPNFATTVTNSIATKLSLSGGTLTGDLTISEASPAIFLSDTSGTPSNPDYKIQVNAGDFFINDETNSATRIKINADGHVDFLTNVDFASGIDVTGNISVVNNNPTITLTDDNNNPDYQVGNVNGVLRFQDITNNATRFQVNTDGHIDFLSNCDFAENITLSDNKKIILGDSGESDSFISFDGANLLIKETSATGSLRLTGQNIFLTNPSESDETYLKCNGQATDRNVELYCQGTQRLETTSTGISVTGQIIGTSHLDLPSDSKLKLGNSDEFTIFHQSSNGNSIIKENGGGTLSLQTNGSAITFFDTANNTIMAQFITGGACQFKHGADIRLETTSTGVAVTGAISQSDTGGTSNSFGTNIQINTTFPSISLNDTDSENDFHIQNQNGLFVIKDTDRNVNVFTIEGRSGQTNYGETGIAGNLAVDTDTLFVDASSNKVGIGTASPTNQLHIYDSANANDQAELKKDHQKYQP